MFRCNWTMSAHEALVPQTLAAVIAIVLPMIAFFTSWRARRRAQLAQPVRAEQTLESRIAALSTSMNLASQLLVLVETELKAREEKARQLDAEVKRSEQLALLTQDQKEAVRSVLRGEIVSEGRRANWLAFLWGFAFFIAGSGVGYLFTYVHH